MPLPLPAAPLLLPATSLTGKLVEISGELGTCCTTLAAAIVQQAQCEGELAAWLQPAGGPLYPPDLATCGIDVASLIVIHTPAAAGPFALPKAAELLLRSGGFGCVVLDFCDAPPDSQHNAWQGRLLGLARQHHSSVLLLTRKAASTGSLGPLVSLRVEPQRRRAMDHLFMLQPEIVKNKAGLALDAIMAQLPLLRQGPWGL